ncbi:MAG: hypothetical protein KJO07_09860 [Deltaproteobacteria bacterium]|nr:hypothetical protein [Deltaproteobacteria bacterium]
MKLFARSAAEADLYVDLECEAAGEVPQSRKRKKTERRRQTFWSYQIRCASGKLLEFEFELDGLPEPKPGLRRKVEYGGKEPSRLIDAGEWLRVADRHANLAPKSVAGLPERQRREAAGNLEIAIAAVGETLKFIPAGGDRVSSTVLTSTRGKTYFNKDVRRFTRSALEELHSELESRMRRYKSSRV